MTASPNATRTVMIGGYSHTVRPGTAGRFGCDPCFFCSIRPAAGQTVWHTSYGDVVCDSCTAPVAPAPAPFFHGDYMTFHLHCAAVEYTGLEAGDVVWVPSADSFNPWREMVEMVEVGPTGWVRVRPVGGNDSRGALELRWLPTTVLYYMARNVPEVELAERKA
jgi:hypothetical protein